MDDDVDVDFESVAAGMVVAHLHHLHPRLPPQNHHDPAGQGEEVEEVGEEGEVATLEEAAAQETEFGPDQQAAKTWEILVSILAITVKIGEKESTKDDVQYNR